MRVELFILLFAAFAVSHARADEERAPTLSEIVDLDPAGAVVQRRSDMQFDGEQRRVADRVFDGQRRQIAVERFAYDANGRLTSREYHLPSGELKWRWTNFQYRDDGQPASCEIVNGRGKRIGHYRWRYGRRGELQRRDRCNADGSLRFYYAEIVCDEAGGFVSWSKFEPPVKRVGVKHWKYVP